MIVTIAEDLARGAQGLGVDAPSAHIAAHTQRYPYQ